MAISEFRRMAFPAERLLAIDTLRLGHRKPMMNELSEIDLTRYGLKNRIDRFVA